MTLSKKGNFEMMWRWDYFLKRKARWWWFPRNRNRGRKRCFLEGESELFLFSRHFLTVWIFFFFFFFFFSLRLLSFSFSFSFSFFPFSFRDDIKPRFSGVLKSSPTAHDWAESRTSSKYCSLKFKIFPCPGKETVDADRLGPRWVCGKWLVLERKTHRYRTRILWWAPDLRGFQDDPQMTEFLQGWDSYFAVFSGFLVHKKLIRIRYRAAIWFIGQFLPVLGIFLLKFPPCPRLDLAERSQEMAVGWSGGRLLTRKPQVSIR